MFIFCHFFSPIDVFILYFFDVWIYYYYLFFLFHNNIKISGYIRVDLLDVFYTRIFFPGYHFTRRMFSRPRVFVDPDVFYRLPINGAAAQRRFLQK